MVQGGLKRTFDWARAGAVLGVVLGAVLWGVYALEPTEVVAGGLVGAVAGLVLGGAAGSVPGAVLAGVLGAGLGAAAGQADLAAFYRVVGAGLGAGLYWTPAAALVGLFAGASVGSRAAPQILAGPLYSRIFAKNPLAMGRDLRLGIGLMVGGAGVFIGASIGMTSGALFGSLAGLVKQNFEGAVVEGLPLWALAGAIVGLVLAFLYVLPLVARARAGAFGGWAVPDPLMAVLTCAIGAAAGAALAALAWSVPIPPGGVVYWALAGAVTGGMIAAKLWSVAEK
jgi:hypothetical protein